MSKINEYKGVEQIEGSELFVVETNEGTRNLSMSLINKKIQDAVDNSANYIGSEGITINNGVISADETLARVIQSVTVIKTIDMTKYASARTSLALSVKDENNEWIANTEVFPEIGIYKLINASGKYVTGGGTTARPKTRIHLTNDTVYINYQAQTVDIYDEKQYTVYHLYNNTDVNEKWDEFFHITDKEIGEKIADAIPFVNKPKNASQVNVWEHDFDFGAINRIVFPCTLCDYADNPLIELKVNDLVLFSSDEWSVGLAQVITKEGTYFFKMCAGVDEETGDYIYDDPLPPDDCIVPTKGEVKKLIQSLTDRIEKLETALAAASAEKEGSNE